MMEREGEGEVGRRRRRGRREGEMMKRGRGGGEMRKGILIGGMILSLLLGCNNGAIEELEKKSSFYESVVKIGQGFQEIFGVFGKAMGDALGFGAVKSTDNRSVVGTHFDKVKKGLGDTKDQLDKLAKEITSTPHADTTSVDVVIKGANAVLTKLITSVTKLSGAVGNTEIGDNSASKAVAADPSDVNAVIESVKEIIEVAETSGVKIDKGNPGVAVNFCFFWCYCYT